MGGVKGGTDFVEQAWRLVWEEGIVARQSARIPLLLCGDDAIFDNARSFCHGVSQDVDASAPLTPGNFASKLEGKTIAKAVLSSLTRLRLP